MLQHKDTEKGAGCPGVRGDRDTQPCLARLGDLACDGGEAAVVIGAKNRLLEESLFCHNSP